LKGTSDLGILSDTGFGFTFVCVQDQLVTEMYTFFAREGELSQILLSVR